MTRFFTNSGVARLARYDKPKPSTFNEDGIGLQTDIKIRRFPSRRSSNTGVASVEEFPPLSSATRPRSAGHPPSTSALASAAISTEGFDSIVDDVCDSYLDGCSVFSLTTRTAILIFPASGL